jgi:hypothetical protein
MPKAIVDFTSNERPVLSSKMDQVVTDYVTPGLPIISLSSLWFVDNRPVGDGGNGITVAGVSQKVLGWYPYNGAKSVFNRMRLLFGYSEIDGATFTNLQFTTDSGGTWSNALAGAVAPSVDLNLANEFMNTFDLSAVTTAQWIGFRMSMLFDVTDESAFNFMLTAFLYNSDAAHDPF